MSPAPNPARVGKSPDTKVSPSLPLVGISCCLSRYEGRTIHQSRDYYIRAIADVAQAVPILLPARPARDSDIATFVSCLSGLLLTGSPSNVHPQRYRRSTENIPEERYAPFDVARDGLVFPLIRAALASGIPILAICRGFQELNVACGGTLHLRLHEKTGNQSHHPPDTDVIERKFAPRHAVELYGWLSGMLEKVSTTVNSLHYQGIAKLGDNLTVEARAPDGVVEAIRVADAKTFALGVQWHPEFAVRGNPDSTKIFTAFGQAALARHDSRNLAASSE